jgi:hypothetical protein
MFMKKDTQIPALHAYRSTRSANSRQRSRAMDVAFGSKGDIGQSPNYVCFTPQSRHRYSLP